MTEGAITTTADTTGRPRVYPLTAKAIRSLRETGYLNCWEGSVRSGKTVASSLAWLAYVCASPENTFVMSGNTVGSLYRNVIGGDYGLLAICGSLANYRVDRQGNRVLQISAPGGQRKNCYCFGAHDEASFKALRGFTPGGWYADEVNLHPRSFVEEALRRTIVSRDRRHFWTLNPDNPKHYIYTEFLDPYEKKEMAGFHLWKFYLEDNLAISEERKAELRSQYAGVFYRRYILGERCVAEGVIYANFLAPENFYTTATRPAGLEYLAQRRIAIDYGTTNPCAFLEVFDDGTNLYWDREYYWDSKEEHREKEDSEYADDLGDFVDRYPDFPPLVTVDPSAASFLTTLRQRIADGKLNITLRDADNVVMDGIRRVSTLLKKRVIRINEDACPNLIKELNAYAWNDKLAREGKEEPIKQSDHLLDPARYDVNTNVAKWRIGEAA